jgi:putative thioredoxin
VDLSALVNRPASAAAGSASAGEPIPLPGLTFDGTDANFNDFLDLSASIPVVVDLGTDRSETSTALSAVLVRLIEEYRGRLVLVRVDVDANPQLAQAFQAQSIPTVAAVIAGRPVALFAGAPAEEQIRSVLEQVLQIAQQNGVTGTADVPAVPDDARVEPEPEPLPPHHAEAVEAIERGDYEGAISEYKAAIAQNPRDDMAAAGLAQVSLLARVRDLDPSAVRAAAAENPSDLDAQLAVADLDLSGGHTEDAFSRLLDTFPAADADGRERIRARLLDYFEIVGTSDPRVTRARARLASLLY